MIQMDTTEKGTGLKNWVTRQRILISRISIIWWVALIYFVVISLAEALTTLVAPRVGLVLHGLTLVALLMQSAWSDQLSTRRFLLALSLAPLTRLLSLVLPLTPLPLIFWYLIVGVLISMAAVFAARVCRMNRVELGLTFGKLPFQFLVSLTGVGLGYIEYRILQPEPLIAYLRWELIWFPALVLLIFTGFLEEFIFRGLLQRTAVDKLGQGGLFYTAAIFAVLHLGYQSAIDVVFVFGVALFLGWAVQRSGSILGVTVAHGLTNIGLFLVYPFLLAS